MNNVERLYYTLQENDCDHWFRDNADALRLAEYLDKKGMIVPPCKVGDVLYAIVNNEIEGFTVTRFGFIVSASKMEANISSHNGEYTMLCSFQNIGKTVFLTREEAEKALKGGGEE